MVEKQICRQDQKEEAKEENQNFNPLLRYTLIIET